jgi:hypothetical protein
MLIIQHPPAKYPVTIGISQVEKIFSEQLSSEPKVKVLVPLYLPFKSEKCAKCGHVIAEEKELIRIVPQSVADAVNRKGLSS